MASTATWSALNDPHRRRVLELLRGRPRDVGELTSALGLSQPTTSHHLARLAKAGLLERERDGSFVRFRVADEAFARLRGVFAED